MVSMIQQVRTVLAKLEDVKISDEFALLRRRTIRWSGPRGAMVVLVRICYWVMISGEKFTDTTSGLPCGRPQRD